MWQRFDQAKRELKIERLDMALMRSRLRRTEARLKEAGDLLHVRESAHEDEIALWKCRSVNLKRKIERLTNNQRKYSEERIQHLEYIAKEYNKDAVRRMHERDQWRETSISSDENLKILKARKAKNQSLSALLHTERALSASLRKQLEEARKTAKNADGHKAKSFPRDSEKARYGKVLEAEEAKTADLRQKPKQYEASLRTSQREMTKLRDTCEDLEKKLNDALERAAKAEERTADLENRSASRSRGLASSGGDMLVSPIPLQLSGQPAEYIASESRNRFTATLPLAFGDEGSLLDDGLEGLTNSPVNVDITSRLKQKNLKRHKLAPPRKSLQNFGTKTLKRPASRREMVEPTSLRGPETKKRRRTGPAWKVNNPSNDLDKSLTDPCTPSDDAPEAIRTPRRKHGKATRKITGSSPAQKRQEEQEKELSSIEPPKNTMRSRRPNSYNDAEQGRDLVSTQDSFEVDFERSSTASNTRERNA